METIRKMAQQVRQNPASRMALMEAVCRQITQKVGSTRASVWAFSALQDHITCECLYDVRTGAFSSGARLNEDDFADYFKAIKDDLKVVAPDAREHPATSCFNTLYFLPNNIFSLLDFVVLDGREPVAVLCCEHCRDERAWTRQDMDFLQAMSAALAPAFGRQKRTV